MKVTDPVQLLAQLYTSCLVIGLVLLVAVVIVILAFAHLDVAQERRRRARDAAARPARDETPTTLMPVMPSRAPRWDLDDPAAIWEPAA
ncbi:hypothetical protein V6N00_13940 [Tersicoccus sp. MR15.9]|uniref:hypothetical protein n=1 Tax=Tersicoccus mangrovi TaxID=3121635 RepID=UPI002FE5E928